MALVFNAETGERVLLRANHVFGRSESRSDTCIVAADVSLIHAVVRFRDAAWWIADFSRNGTLVDGELLRPGRWLAFRQGQEILFGRSSGSVWQVQDLSAPGTSLIPIDPGREPLLLCESQLLPHPESPEIAVFQDASGDWLLDRDGEVCRLAGGDAVTVSGVTYRLMVSERLDETAEARSMACGLIQLAFAVSADEEHVRLRLMHGSGVVDLGERTHHYCLLTLARLRLRDARSRIAAAEQGWCDSAELADMLGISVTHLNIQIYRARQQLMSSAPVAAQLAKIIERRRGSLRLGELPFEITRDSSTEGHYRPSAMEVCREALR